MFNFFKSKTPNIINDIGEFKYFEDEEDKYWELISSYKDERYSIDIDFLALFGTPSRVHAAVEGIAKKLLNNPDTLWALIDNLFISSASEDINGISKNCVQEHFYIKSLAIENEDSFEVGFHALESDIFLELFVVKGKVLKIEKDYGCCEI